jgi:integrase
MSPKTDTKPKWALASYELNDAYTDFILSRQAMLCSPRTISWYTFTLGRVLDWMVENGISVPEEIQARHVRAYLAEMAVSGASDSYVNNHARAIRTLLRFFHAEKYIPEPVTFRMPTIAEKRMPVLSKEEVKKLLAACRKKRDKAVILFLVDTGLRSMEFCALTWGDVDISSGLVHLGINNYAESALP